MNQTPKDRRPQIAFAGRSNVGKSTLLNRLVGRKKVAKVSATPGKTRALNFFLINESFYFVDLPGYGFAKVPRKVREEWGRLMEQYLNEGPSLIGLIFLLDCRRDPNEDDLQLLGWLSHRKLPTMVVVTKMDKLSRNKANQRLKQVEKELGLPAIGFSSTTGIGKKELMGAIFDLIEENSQALT